MLKHTAKILALLLSAAMLTACGGGDYPDTGTMVQSQALPNGTQHASVAPELIVDPNADPAIYRMRGLEPL